MNLKFIFLNFAVIVIFGGCQSDQSFEIKDNNSTEPGNNSAIIGTSPLRIMGHWLGEGKKELIVRESVREFSLLNQNSQILLEFPNQIFDVEESQLYFAECDSISKMVLANKWPWDVLFCDQERYRRVGELINDPNWGETYLVDFSKRPWFINVHKNGLFESSNYKARYGNTIPGPILEGITDIMFVSEEVENKLGIKVKSLDMTSGELLQYAKAVYDYNTSHSDKITFFSTQLVNATSLLFMQLLLSEYGKTKPGSRGEGIRALEKTYKFLEQLSKYKPTEQYIDYTGILYDKAQRILFHDKCLFSLQPTWMYLLWQNSNPEGIKKMRPCEIPSLDAGVSNFYVGMFQVIFVVPKNAQNPEAAERFIQFISSAETADKWIKYSKCPTGLKTTISYTDFGQDLFDIFFQHLQKKYGNNQTEIDLSSYVLNSKSTIDFKVPDVLNGNLTAAQALNNAIRQIR